MKLARTAALLPLLLAATLAAGAEVSVSLHPESAVAGAYFTLGDIARVTAAEAVDAELAGLRVGRSPRAGTALTLGRDEVERAIIRLKPALKDRLRLSGAQHAVVRRGPLQSVERARIREAAEHALRAHLAERYERYEVEAAGEPGEGAPLAVPEGRVEFRPRIVSAGPTPSRPSVWTDVYVDGRHYQSVPVPFAVRGYTTVLRARSTLRAGQLARGADFSVGEEQVAGYADSPVPADMDLSRLRLKRPVADGEVLTWRHAEQAPAVSRNQEISVRLAAGSIVVETAAIALQDARPGEVIRVRPAAGQHAYPARVTGAGAVEALWR